MSVALRPLRRDEWDAWRARSHEGYAHQLEHLGGYDPALAARKADDDFARLLPDGPDTPGTHVFVAEADGEAVGHLWLRERPESEVGPVLWVSDVEVVPERRREGHGRAIMLAAEAEARRLGFDALGLNVFTGNHGARALYESLGYEVTEVHDAGQNMRKALAQANA